MPKQIVSINFTVARCTFELKIERNTQQAHDTV